MSLDEKFFWLVYPPFLYLEIFGVICEARPNSLIGDDVLYIFLSKYYTFSFPQKNFNFQKNYILKSTKIILEKASLI